MTAFTFPGKLGDAILQWPVARAWSKKTGECFEAWLDEKTLKPLVPLFESQTCCSKVVLKPGVENYNCGGQPFHMNLPTADLTGNRVFHLGMRAFPQRQLTLQAMQDSHVGNLSVEDLLEPSFDLGDIPKANRLVLHGQALYTHTRTTPGFWRFLASIRDELSMFDEVVWVGSKWDREVGKETYPQYDTFDDGGDFKKLAEFIAGSRCMIGVGSAPITVAGALKVPAIRVHDELANNPPKVIWSHLGENQINETHTALRTEWPKFRDRFLAPAPAGA